MELEPIPFRLSTDSFPTPNGGKCSVAVWGEGWETYAIFTERAGDEGAIITNCIEVLATRCVETYPLDETTRWFHEANGVYSEITFDWENKVASNPEWKHISREVVTEALSSKEP